MMDEKYRIEYEQALKMLPDSETIHTFRDSAIALIGADWEREKVIEAIKRYGVYRSGEQATRMKHGLVLEDETGYLFIETSHILNAEQEK